MLSNIALSALISAAAVSAVPWGQGGNPANWGQGPPQPQGGWQSSAGSWAAPTYTSTAGPNAAQTPFSYPLTNGFPGNVSESDLEAIERQAHGTLPNGPLPSNITDKSAATFSLIAFNELFEVAFFTSLIFNITNNVPGYEVGSHAVRNIVLNSLSAVQAQEELHALGANGILNTAGRPAIQPCEYVFPVSDFDSAITLASTFTDVVLGTLQDALNNFATDGDSEFAPLIGSVIGQEGEQNGFYRNLGNKIPSALPFLTRSAGPFAFSALNQNFVVNGTCGNIKQIPLPIFAPLTLETPNITASTSSLQFSFINTPASTAAGQNVSIVYINQQNLPVTQPLQSVSNSNGITTFSANFPYDEYLLNGLTIAAVVQGTGNISNADAVASATLFGPALIEVY